MLISEKNNKIKSHIEVQNVCPQWDSNLQFLSEYMLAQTLFLNFQKKSIICFKLKIVKLNYLIVQTYSNRNWEAALLIKPVKNINTIMEFLLKLYHYVKKVNQKYYLKSIL